MPFELKFPESFFESNRLKRFRFFLLFMPVICMVYQSQQSDFYTFFPVYTLCFLGYLIILKCRLTESQIFWIGLSLRFAIIFAFPAWSDDIYRFFWDGTLCKHGIMPYGILPGDILDKGISGIDGDLFNKLNSKGYYTVYPPVSQLYYFISSLPGDIYICSLILKVLLIFTEAIGFVYLIRLLKFLGKQSYLASIYYLNPLVIIEGVGNLHFEIAMVAFLCISLYGLSQNQWIKAALFIALSIGVKLLPLMVLPFLFWQMPTKARLHFFGGIIMFLGIIFIPMASGIQISSFFISIDLYFQKFEFHASIYYILRYLGHLCFGYNMIYYIGPLLGISTLLINLYLAKRTQTYDFNTFLTYCLLVWTVYLLFTTTVHPWYVIALVFLSVFSTYRYALIWSFVVILSYTFYSKTGALNYMWYTSLAYLLMGSFMFYEFYFKPTHTTAQ